VVTRHLMSRPKPRSLRFVDRHAHFIAVSDAVAGVLGADPALKPRYLHVVRCGIDTGHFAPSAAVRTKVRAELGFADGDFAFVQVGNAHPPEGKGQFYFVRAAAAVAATHPEARFVCIGDGELMGEVKAEAERLGLGAAFRFIPFCADLAAWLPGMDALVHPAVGSEALGLVIIEALTCARPVIASRLDGIPETFVDGEHGYLVPPKDVPALAAAMDAFLADPRAAMAMGARGREWTVADFSMETMTRATLAVYGQTLTKPAGSSV